MKNWVKSGIVLILITVLTSFNFIMLGNHIVLAAQDNMINTNHINFDAYFLKDDQKIHVCELNIGEESNLFIELNSDKDIMLDNVKIKIDNANFKILKDKISNSIIKNINEETNEIELNQVISQNSFKIEIPIGFSKKENFEEDYFERQNTIIFNGSNGDNEINLDVNTQVKWTSSQAEVNLYQDIEKCINLDDETMLVQQKILTEVKENILPRKHEDLEIVAPIVEEKEPKEIKILVNGIEEKNIDYNKQTKKIRINVDSTGTWINSTNEYKIIYKYEGLSTNQNQVDLNTILNTQLYTKDIITKEDKQDKINLQRKGEIISVSKLATNEIYKGYFYAESNKETIYMEDNQIEISDISTIEDIKIQSYKDNFIDSNNREYDITNKIGYKKTILNKLQVDNIIGSTGEIIIKGANEKQLAVINSDTQSSIGGIIEINYEDVEKEISVTVNNPISCGKLEIINNKYIEGNTGYSKEQLKSFNLINTKTKINSKSIENIADTNINLKDTITEGKLEINNKDLTTLQTNENVQLMVTLKSNSNQNDLFKNPNIEILMPQGVTANIKNIAQINLQEELHIINPKALINNDGRQIISMQLEGEQKTFGNEINEGIQIAIIADVITDKSTPSRSDKIEMNYTNENKSNEHFYACTDIQLISKPGILMINKLSNYNDNGDVLESIDDKTKVANLDVNSNEKEANEEITIVNNNETPITNVKLIGRVPDINEEIEDGEKADFKLKLLSGISIQGADAKIYYSQNNDDMWTENVENLSDISAFKIELLNNELNGKEVMKINFKFNIPEDIKYGDVSNCNMVLDYTAAESNVSIKSNIKLQAALGNSITNLLGESAEEVENLEVSLTAKSGGKNLSENDEVYEGQGIEYEINVTNKGDTEYKNLKINASNSNAIYYDEVKVFPDVQPDDRQEAEKIKVTKIEENEELQLKEFEIESLKSGETKKFTYQISAKEVEGEDDKIDSKIQIKTDNLEEEINGVTLSIKQAELKLSLRNSYEEEIKVLTGSDLPVELKIRNIENRNLNNIDVEFEIPENVEFSTENIILEENSGIQFVEYKNGIIKFKLDSIEAKAEKQINIGLIAPKMNYDVMSQDLAMRCYANVNNIKYISNDIHRTIYQYKTLITAVQEANAEENSKLEDGDKVQFKYTIENKGKIDSELNIVDEMPDGLVIDKAYFIKNGEKQNIDLSYQNMEEESEEIDDDDIEKFEKTNDTKEENNSNDVKQISNIIDETFELKSGEKIYLIIDTYADISRMEDSKIENYATITGIEIDEIETNKITYYLIGNEEEIDDENNANRKENRYTVSGTAWIDENKNGMMEETEGKVSNMEVVLVDEKTGNIITDEQGNKKETQTHENGEYTFDNLNVGNYFVIFKYDVTRYYLTEYQKEGVSDTLNSDVIDKEITLDEQTQQVAITGTIKLEQNQYNIDAGFIEGEKFDLSIQKGITKLIVQNSAGTKINTYNNVQLARTEIDAKRIAGSTVIIEYSIIVKNEGEVPGYANEIIDYVPNDIKFSSENNKEWYQSADGNLHTKILENEIINPGESKEIKLVLIKNMTENNVGTTINTAEIGKSSNYFSLKDIDSTTNNKASGEDDMSTAEAIISIRTGLITYIGLAIGIITICIGGIYFIKKKVLINK